MNPIVFEHWANVHDLERLEKARETIRQEIANGTLKGIQYVAEEKLLTMKIGRP